MSLLAYQALGHIAGSGKHPANNTYQNKKRKGAHFEERSKSVFVIAFSVLLGRPVSARHSTGPGRTTPPDTFSLTENYAQRFAS